MDRKGYSLRKSGFPCHHVPVTKEHGAETEKLSADTLGVRQRVLLGAAGASSWVVSAVAAFTDPGPVQLR